MINHSWRWKVLGASFVATFSYIHSLENIKHAAPEKIIKGETPIDDVHREMLVPKDSILHALWSRPPDGISKLNVDGSFVAQDGSAGVGMILRRSDGFVVFSACKSLHFCSSALDAKIHASLVGIRLALDISQENFVVETDSVELVKMATSTVKDASVLGHLV
jgi:hypothetical protein